MKVILDCGPEVMSSALQASFNVMRENPALEVGKTKKVTVNGQTFVVRRNTSSLTVEQK